MGFLDDLFGKNKMAMPGQGGLVPNVGQGGGQQQAAAAPAQMQSTEHRAGVTYDPSNLIKTYLPGAPDKVVQALITQLKANESKGGPEYHAALTQLIQQYPDLQQFTPLGQAGIGQGTLGASGGVPDPLAFQAFFNQSVAPYLNQVSQQTQQMEAPLYAQAEQGLSKLPGDYGKVFGAYLPIMQANENQTMGALQGAAAAAPGLDAIVSNAQNAQAAALKAYYEAIYAKTYGAAGGVGGAVPGVAPPKSS